MKKRVALWVLIICLLLCVTGCGRKGADAEQGSAPASGETEMLAPEEPDTVYEIETPFANMQFPEKWKDNLTVKTAENSADFFAVFEGKPETLVFTLRLGEGDGYHLGTLGDQELYIVEGNPNFDESWTEAEKQAFYDMQESVNVILQGLVESDGFTYAS